MRRLAIVLLSLGLLAGITPAAHAELAGTEFAPTRCWSYAPVYGTWAGQVGVGVVLRSAYDRYGDWVTGRIYQFHRNTGAECGQFGFPITAAIHGAGYDVQYFARPGSCSLPYIVDYLNGQAAVGYELPRYFCQGP